MDIGALAVVEKSDKELVPVVFLVGIADLLVCNAVLYVGVNGGENTSVNGQKVRNEGDGNILAAEL